MWRTIIRGCAQQFHGQMDVECQHHFGMSITHIREILTQYHDIHDLESMDEDESVFTQHEESVGTPVSED